MNWDERRKHFDGVVSTRMEALHYAVLNLLEAADFIDHGISCRCAYITPAGRKFLTDAEAYNGDFKRFIAEQVEAPWEMDDSDLKYQLVFADKMGQGCGCGDLPGIAEIFYEVLKGYWTPEEPPVSSAAHLPMGHRERRKATRKQRRKRR